MAGLVHPERHASGEPRAHAAPEAERSREDQMGGFAKGLAVIEAFGRGRTTLTIADVARATGLDRATARRCLLTLLKAGYATSDGRLFSLTPRVLRLGQAYLSASLRRLVQPSLESLADDIRESCSASVLDGTEVVYIARASQHRLIGVGLHPGSRLPAYCSSMGRVLLAALPPAQSRELLAASDRRAITARTLTGVDALMRELDTVRSQGYAIVDQELEIDSRSIAAPIRDISGRTVAAFTVGAHATQASLERMREQILPRMLEMQRSLGEILP